MCGRITCEYEHFVGCHVCCSAFCCINVSGKAWRQFFCCRRKPCKASEYQYKRCCYCYDSRSHGSAAALLGRLLSCDFCSCCLIQIVDIGTGFDPLPYVILLLIVRYERIQSFCNYLVLVHIFTSV